MPQFFENQIILIRNSQRRGESFLGIAGFVFEPVSRPALRQLLPFVMQSARCDTT
jgi:hypothetical protein